MADTHTQRRGASRSRIVVFPHRTACWLVYGRERAGAFERLP